MNKKMIGVLSSFLLLCVAAVGIYFAGHTAIPAGMSGIVYKANGGVVKETIGEGWTWQLPVVTKVSLFTTSTEQSALSARSGEGGEKDESFVIMTADGKGVDIDFEFSYSFDAEQLPATFKRFKGKNGAQIEQEFIKPKIKAVANNVSTQFSVLHIFGEGRPELNAAILKEAKSFFAEYGIIIESAQVTEMRLDEKTQQIIQNVVDKQQQLEEVKLEKEIAKENAEKLKIQAQGEAEAVLIKAQGDRKANEELSKSLTAELLKKMEMEARLKHGWVEINGAATAVVEKK
ncbi:MAG: prohibitin family protein [Bacilli bacterium]